jgi:serine/threonine-protein kinase
MAQPKLIDPRREPTPAEAAALRGPRALPPDLLKDASRRLEVLSLLGVVLWSTAPVLHVLSARAMGSRLVEPWLTWTVAGASIAVSLGLFFYARRSRRDPRFVLDLGLVYLVVTSLGIGMIWHLGVSLDHPQVEPMFTWVGPLVMLFAALVPNSTGKTLVAGLVSASMVPIGMLIWRRAGVGQMGAASDALLMHYPDFMLVGIGVVIGRVVTGLGQQVAKARELGSYELGELLGEGGMGQVYRATHRMLARPAAIKLIRPEMLSGGSGGSGGGGGAGGAGGAGVGARSEASDLAIKRFTREALAAANLRSPHTVELYDFGVTADRTFYFAMELLEGMTLDELVRRTGPVPAGRVIHILRQVCESLEEAHTRGLVHRDIKPANIHLGRLGLRYDFVKVLDFGLVKSTRANDDRSHATATGLAAGTPAFMAPEIALGDAIDGRADLYALGCVAYYLLAGRPVFEGDNVVQVMAKHLNAEPVPPSEHSAVAIPADLERLVLACLEKKPADRPESAAELARALAEVEAEPWGDREAEAWWRGRELASR